MLHNIRLIVPVLQQLVYSVLWHQSNLFPTSSAIWPQSSPKNWGVSMTSTLTILTGQLQNCPSNGSSECCSGTVHFKWTSPSMSWPPSALKGLLRPTILAIIELSADSLTCQIYNFLGRCCFQLPTNIFCLFLGCASKNHQKLLGDWHF